MGFSLHDLIEGSGICTVCSGTGKYTAFSYCGQQEKTEDSLCLTTKSTRILAQTPGFELLRKQKKRQFRSNRRVAFICKNIYESFPCYSDTNLLNGTKEKKTGLDLTEEL